MASTRENPASNALSSSNPALGVGAPPWAPAAHFLLLTWVFALRISDAGGTDGSMCSGRFRPGFVGDPNPCDGERMSSLEKAFVNR